MAVVVLIIVLVGLLAVGAAAVVMARRRPGLARPAAAVSGPEANNSSIDPFAVSEPWRQFVQRGLAARDRFQLTLRTAPDGPLRAQLQDIGDALDRGMTRVWSIAQHGHRLGQARGRIDTRRLTAALGSPQASPVDAASIAPQDHVPIESLVPEALEGGVPGGTAPLADDAVRGSLQAQLDSANRLDGIMANAEGQLRLLTTHLDEAATRAGELAVRAGSGAALEAVAAEVTRASDQLEALRLAMEEIDRL